MKILYLSCHEILEFDEVSLFHELGHEVFSPGAYVCNENRGDGCLRPSIPGLTYNPDIVEMWNRHEAKHPSINGKEYLFESPEIIDYFDTIIVMHLPQFILPNWNAMKHKRIIWRTIGQSLNHVELQLKPCRAQGMEIVRYSPRETRISEYIGEDALIRFYKDPEEYKGWNGNNPQVITIAQDMQNRNEACNFSLFEEVTRPFPRKLIGSGSDNLPYGTGKIPFDQLKTEMRNSRAYFYTGTHPASYTLNFIESWMSGIPIVAIGPKHGNASYFPGHDLYEIPDLIENYSTGFVSDDLAELQDHVKILLDNQDLANLIGSQGRQAAIRHFGKDLIKESWASYLGQ